MPLVFHPHLTAAIVSFAAGITLQAEPLSPAEAQDALRKAQTSRAEPGTYRRETVRTTKSGTVTTIVLTKRTPGTPLLTRTERVTAVHGHPEKTQTRLTYQNAEGRWQLYGNKALLMPNPIDGGRILESLQAPQPGGGNAPGAPAAKDKTARQAADIARHTHFAGERFTEDGRKLIRVARSFDEEGAKMVQDIFDEHFSAMKKQLSLGKRMLISTVLAAKGGVGSMIPVKEVFIIDPATNTILSTERFNSAGKQIGFNRTGPPAEKIDDLPPEMFSLPAGVELIRPKSLEEAMELTEKFEAEEKKAAR